MEKYSEYKDSGVQWLGQIPSHWKSVKLKFIIDVKSGDVVSQETISSDASIPIYGGGEPLGFCNCSNTLESDIIVGRVGARCGCINYPRRQVWATDNALIISSKINVPFTAYSLGAANLNNLNSANAQPLITGTKIKNHKIALPPLPEQQAIVSFLDCKCAKIDQLLANKQKEIDLLQEMKQRVIADAVTKGLNPDVKFKETGILWLPQIPEHWDVQRAKNLYNKEQRPVEDGDDIVTCFRDGQVTLRKNRRTTGFTEATNYTGYQHICKGDLVIHQMDAFAGSSGVSDSDGMGTPVLSVCTSKTNKTDNYYFAHILRLMGKNGYILSLYRGIRERSSDFRFDTFAKQYLPVPPIEEQKAIVSYIEERVSKIDALGAKLQQEIDSIKEYKQRLIADVVTGQIKVC